MTGIPVPQEDLLRLENDRIAVDLWPGCGFDVYRMIDRDSGVDALYKTPWGHRADSSPTGSTQSDWLARYAGGWQVLVPNGGDPGNRHGAPQGFHGEAAISAWTVTDRQAEAVAAELYLLSAPFRIRRRVRLHDASLVIEEAIDNLSPQLIEYDWVHHPALGRPFLEPGCTVSVDCVDVVTEPGRGGHESGREVRTWPLVTADGTMRDLGVIPEDGTRSEVFATLAGFESGHWSVTNPRRGLRFGLDWDLEIFPYAWFWQDLEASSDYPWFRRAYVTAIEPASFIPGNGSAGGYARGTRLSLEGGGSTSTTVVATFSSTTDFDASRRAARAAAGLG